jgi:hypothetical protein
VVSKNSNNTVIFSNGNTFRKFVFGIYEKEWYFASGAACDVLKWSWVQKYSGNDGNGDAVIYAPLDESGLTNDGRSGANMRCSGDEDIAKRDIAKGEEITCSYSDFVSHLCWKELGL